MWRGGTQGEPELLASCYRNAMTLATGAGISSLAFPSISTGIYGYPLALAAQVALDTVRAALAKPSSIRELVFCCYSPADLWVYESLLA